MSANAVTRHVLSCDGNHTIELIKCTIRVRRVEGNSPLRLLDCLGFVTLFSSLVFFAAAVMGAEARFCAKLGGALEC